MHISANQTMTWEKTDRVQLVSILFQTLANSKCLRKIITVRYTLFLSDLSWNQDYPRRISSFPCKLCIFDNLLAQSDTASDYNGTSVLILTVPKNIVKCVTQKKFLIWTGNTGENFQPWDQHVTSYQISSAVHKRTGLWVVSRNHNLDNLSLFMASGFTTVEAARKLASDATLTWPAANNKGVFHPKISAASQAAGIAKSCTYKSENLWNWHVH